MRSETEGAERCKPSGAQGRTHGAAALLALLGGLLLAATPILAQTGTYTLNGGTANLPSIAETTSTSDQSGILVYNGGSLTVGTVTISTSGNATDQDKSGRYGVNAGILAGTSSSKGTIVITGSANTVTTTGSIANGLFATGSGSSITMNGGTIEASGANAHGVDVTYGGAITLHDVDITTHSGSSSAVATDFGGGTVAVTGGTIVAADPDSGSHSAGIYSTGTISVTGATVSSVADLGGVIDGANSILLTDTALTGAIGGIRCWKTAPATGNATVTLKGGSLTATTGDAFIVTGSTGTAAAATITVSDGAAIHAGSGILLNVDGGSTAALTMKGVTLTGNLVATSTSKATASLQDGATLTGTASGVGLSLDASSAWVVAGNSTVTSLVDPAGISGLAVTNITGNGFMVYYDPALAANASLGGLAYSLNGGGLLAPVGYTAEAPVVTGLSPVSGATAGGTAVTISGSGFTGATAVRFGAAAASSFAVQSDASISAVSPSHAEGAVHVTVTTSVGTSATGSADQFTYEGGAACALSCTATAPAQGVQDKSVAFQSTATATGCTGTPTYVWTFGDGGTSSQQDPSHTYALTGSYSWTIVATADGETCTQTGTIVIVSSIPGDCDGDGTVSIGEVQKAINMFLGTQAPDCGVDCSGDGLVSIGEVQKAINAFLGVTTTC